MCNVHEEWQEKGHSILKARILSDSHSLSWRILGKRVHCKAYSSIALVFSNRLERYLFTSLNMSVFQNEAGVQQPADVGSHSRDQFGGNPDPVP